MVIPHYEPAWRYGGPIRSKSAICRALAAAGCEVTVYTTNLNGDILLDAPTDRCVDVGGVRVRYFAARWVCGAVWSSDLLATLKHTVNEFDLVHCSATWHPLQTFVTRIVTHAQRPLILSAHGCFNPYGWSQRKLKHKLYWRLFEKRNYTRATAIHFTAEAERREAQRILGNLPSFVVPNGIDLAQHQRDETAGKAFRQRYRISDDAVLILSLGRLHPVKGLDLLIRAFADLLDLAREKQRLPLPHLVLVGGDERGYRAELERLVMQHGIAQQVTFTGHLDGQERTAAYSAADIFAFPSHNENFGMSAVEAMAYGLPVILTEGVNIAEEIASDGAAIVVPFREQELAQALTELVLDDEKRRRMSIRALQCATKRYGVNAVAREMIREYEQIIAKEH